MEALQVVFTCIRILKLAGSKVYVYPKYRGKGVGKRLLEEAFLLIRAEGGKLALIDV